QYTLSASTAPSAPFPLSQSQKIPAAAMNITYLGTCFLVIATMLGNSDASSGSTLKTCIKTKKHESDKCWNAGCNTIVNNAKWRMQCPYKHCNQPGCREAWTPTRQICLACRSK
ncbi:hypothetical protein PSTG_03879, partial [Puccinia striiformis f. sp. tritici PST-78]